MEPPDDFPVAEIELLHAYLSDRRPDQNQTIQWKEWATGLNGFVYRYLGCDESGTAAITSLFASTSPPQPERYRQENWLFDFYARGLSCIECLCYGLFFVGSLADPSGLSATVNRRDVTPRFVAQRFAAVFGGTDLSHELLALTRDQAFKDWSTIRHFLSHRGAPGRTFYKGGGPPSGVSWNLPIDQVNAANELTPPRLQERRAWLATTTTGILRAANVFAAASVP